ncbi:DNA-processing protein DprA [Luteipulveratus flavus]|uniref:DNA-processing protein DprA n=1 Tax=Luteipulveratus flavus TaxID=3031728 RepID=A0ABT6C659_9MICO|nr:DNA-processing protein DprA [Luteipulveratus sp. YIM 133296]MDF8263822.1 DNA-processing protein DprA [Luteipulveratus sp. YIM 133296]
MSADAPVVDPLAAERRARVSWARLVEPRDATAAALVAEHGHVEALAMLRRGAATLGRAATERLHGLDLEREWRATARSGARVVVPGDAEWPTGLDDLAIPPHCLWVRGTGDLAALTLRSVAVVGARSATAYGERVAAELGAGLAERGFTIVSGAAFGIDAAAHRGALAVDGRTVAALACGVDRAYPSAHADLLAEIREGGVVVSEVPPGSAPIRPRFLARNRLIAAMTRGTVVVEAGLRSGSLSTARRAIDCGRPVGAVPGPVTSVTSAGTNQLIREHQAELVSDTAEVAELVGDIGVDLAPVRRGDARPEDALREQPRQVWEALPRHGGMPAEQAGVLARLTPAEVLAALGELELVGMAERHGRGWRKTTLVDDTREGAVPSSDVAG